MSLACLQTNSVFFFNAGFYFPSQRFTFLEATADLYIWPGSPGTYSYLEVPTSLMKWEMEEQKDQVLVSYPVVPGTCGTCGSAGAGPSPCCPGLLTSGPVTSHHTLTPSF